MCDVRLLSGIHLNFLSSKGKEEGLARVDGKESMAICNCWLSNSQAEYPAVQVYFCGSFIFNSFIDLHGSFSHLANLHGLLKSIYHKCLKAD